MALDKQKRSRPSRQEILALKKKLQAITKPFFAKYGSGGGKGKKGGKSRKSGVAMMALADGEGGDGGIDFLLVGPPGPRPPPKLEIEILNLSNY